MENLRLLQSKLASLVGEKCVQITFDSPSHLAILIYHFLFPNLSLSLLCKWVLYNGDLRLASSDNVLSLETLYNSKTRKHTAQLTEKSHGYGRKFLAEPLVGKTVTATILNNQSYELFLQFRDLLLVLSPTSGTKQSYCLVWESSECRVGGLQVYGDQICFNWYPVTNY